MLFLHQLYGNNDRHRIFDRLGLISKMNCFGSFLSSICAHQKFYAFFFFFVDKKTLNAIRLPYYFSTFFPFLCLIATTPNQSDQSTEQQRVLVYTVACIHTFPGSLCLCMCVCVCSECANPSGTHLALSTRRDVLYHTTPRTCSNCFFSSIRLQRTIDNWMNRRWLFA